MPTLTKIRVLRAFNTLTTQSAGGFCAHEKNHVMHPKQKRMVLLVEDDAATAESIEDMIASEGYQVTTRKYGADLRMDLEHRTYDLLILGLRSPDTGGFEILKSLDKHSPFGIIVVTDRSDPLDIAVALELGADDYIVIPFDSREFLARVRSVLRRSIRHQYGADLSQSLLQYPGWSFDRAARCVQRAGRSRERLTAGEMRLLTILISNPNKILTRDRLLDLLYPNQSNMPFDRSIDVTITRLRRKIERNARRPNFIKTARGDGYLFDPSGETQAWQ